MRTYSTLHVHTNYTFLARTQARSCLKERCSLFHGTDRTGLDRTHTLKHGPDGRKITVRCGIINTDRTEYFNGNPQSRLLCPGKPAVNENTSKNVFKLYSLYLFNVSFSLLNNLHHSYNLACYYNYEARPRNLVFCRLTFLCITAFIIVFVMVFVMHRNSDRSKAN